jgi:hypothetical protein
VPGRKSDDDDGGSMAISSGRNKSNPRSENPSSNALPAGLTRNQVLDAVAKSGYPLQFFVGELLRNWPPDENASFSVQDEWSFLDRDTNDSRHLDIRADLRLHPWEPQPRVRPQLTLLIECKHSELPYVFFGRKDPLGVWRYPPIAGLHADDINIRTDDSRSTWNYPVSDVLGLRDDKFQLEPIVCTSFAKCTRKGKELELSGTEPYNSLVQPLSKALCHFHTVEKPAETHRYFDAHLTIALAVLDAPTFTVTIEDGAQKLELTPWIRLTRHEFDGTAPKFHQDTIHVIEVVHRDFLQNFLSERLIPFARKFASAVLRHPEELAGGKAFVSGMEADSYTNIESRLRPKSGLLLPKI